MHSPISIQKNTNSVKIELTFSMIIFSSLTFLQFSSKANQEFIRINHDTIISI